MKKIFVVMILAIFALSGLAACNKSAVAFGKRGEIERKVKETVFKEARERFAFSPEVTTEGRISLTSFTFDYTRKGDFKSFTEHYTRGVATLVLAPSNNSPRVEHTYAYKCSLREDSYGELHVDKITLE